MTETLTAQIRIAITMTLSGTLIAITLNLNSTGLKLVNRYMDRYAMAMEAPNSSVLNEMRNTEKVSAALAYRIIEERIGMIRTISITYADGTITSDYKTLLKHAEAFVQVQMSDENGAYSLVISEVR